MKKGFLTAVAVSLICLQTVSFSATETASELASEIAVKESENATLTADITQLNTDIENTRLEIAKTQQEVDESNAIIKGLSTQIVDNKSALKERLLSMYLAGSASNLEIILGADDLDDFMDKLEYISIITENDSRLIGFHIKCTKCKIEHPKRYEVRVSLGRNGEIVTDLDQRKDAIDACI